MVSITNAPLFVHRRIWEASGAHSGSHTVADIAGHFDSCYVSFYKGVGGMTGAMLLGGTEFCEEARVWLRRFGGNLYTLAPYAVSCWAGFRRKVRGCEEQKDDGDDNLLVASRAASKALTVVNIPPFCR